MNNIRNFTPHVLAVALPDGSTLTIPSEGVVRAVQTATQVGTVTLGGHEVPVQVMSFGLPQGVPSLAADDILVVSQIAAQAIANHLPAVAAQVMIPGPLNRETQTISVLCRL